MFHALEKKGMFTRQSINSILGDDWEWLSLGDRLTLVFMENPPLNAQPNAKARELGWPIRGPMVVVAADKDGEEDNVTRADIENLLATAKADLDRRASFARLPSDDNGAAAILTVTSVDESLGGSSPAEEGAQDVCPNGAVNFELNPTLSTSSRKRKHDKEDHVHRQVAQRDNESFVESSELSTAPTSSTSEPSTAATSSSSSSSSSPSSCSNSSSTTCAACFDRGDETDCEDWDEPCEYHGQSDRTLFPSSAATIAIAECGIIGGGQPEEEVELNVTCPGCVAGNQPNLAHMVPGGCLRGVSVTSPAGVFLPVVVSDSDADEPTCSFLPCRMVITGAPVLPIVSHHPSGLYCSQECRQAAMAGQVLCRVVPDSDDSTEEDSI